MIAYQDLLGKPGCQPQDVYYRRVRQTKVEAAADRGLVPAKHEAKTAIPVPQPMGRARAKPYANEWQQYGLTDCILGAQRPRGSSVSPASESQFPVDCGRRGCNGDGHAHHWPTIGRPSRQGLASCTSYSCRDDRLWPKEDVVPAGAFT